MISLDEAEKIKDRFGRLPISMIMTYQSYFCPPPIAGKIIEQRIISIDGHTTTIWGWNAASILESLDRYLQINMLCT